MLLSFSVFFEIFSAVLSLSDTQTTASNNVSSISVVVIGGGVSGLTAAANLHKAGFNVTLLEAMDRIGGRTNTVKLDNGQHVELGAEWVHGEKGNAVFELMFPHGVLDNSTSSEETQFILNSGHSLNETMSERLEEFLNIIWTDPPLWRMDNVTNYGDWGELVLQKFLEDNNLTWNNRQQNFALDMAQKYILGGWSSENWWQASKRVNGEQYETLEGNEGVRWKKPYSYSTLHEFILTGNVTESGSFKLPDWIHLNAEVNIIEYSPEGAGKSLVRTKGGNEYLADHVIYTPSLGVLKSQHIDIFRPALPETKQLAIESLGFGCVGKIFMEFSQPWWSPHFGLYPLWEDQDYIHGNPEFLWWRSNITKSELMKEFDGLPLWCRGISHVATIDSGSAPNFLRVWVSSIPSKIMDEFEAEYVQASVMKTIRKFLSQQFPDITEPVNMIKSSWWSNPYTQGTYSFRTKASDANDVWAKDLAEPILHSETMKPLLCFAGEATNPTHFATVHGAFETGIREYERIKAFYKNM